MKLFFWSDPWSEGKRLAFLALTCAVMVSAGHRARADAIYDFRLSNGSWTPTAVNGPPLANQWQYNAGTGWHVSSQGVDSPTVRTGNRLTSPSIDALVSGTPAKNVRVSIAHNFLFPPGTNGYPNAAGQLSYMINNSGTWVGLPLAAFTSGTGSVNDPNLIFGNSPLNTFDHPGRVDQTAFVAPNFLPPGTNPAYTSLSPLINNGEAFTGTTSGHSSQYVPSQAFINSSTGLTADITSIQLRLSNANLGSYCPTDAGWNVRFLQVDFATTEVPVPEPGTLVMAAAGAAAFVTKLCMRWRRLRRDPASPSPLEAERDALDDDAAAGVGRA